MELLAKVSAFLNKYRWAITMTLFVCCIMQQCTISTLRSEMAFLKHKYEEPANNELLSDNEDAYVVDDEVVVDEVENGATSSSSSVVIWMVVVLALALIVFLLWKFSIFPFGIWVGGKLWQDLTGKIIYTLKISNKGRETVNVGNAMIEFINFKEQRKFKMPVSDFPLSLTKGTQHSVNISLQRLLEQHPDLLDYKMIRVSVECNGKVRKTIPLGVRWKRS